MSFAKPLGHELVERLAEHGGARPQERLLGRGVEQDHALILIHRDDRIHCRLDDIGDASLDVLQSAAGGLTPPHLPVEQEDGQEERDESDDGRCDKRFGAIPVLADSRHAERGGCGDKRDDGAENDQRTAARLADSGVTIRDRTAPAGTYGIARMHQ